MSPGFGITAQKLFDGSQLMKVELQTELFRCYPYAFRKPDKRWVASNVVGAEDDIVRNDTAPIDEHGIECGDGWFVIVNRLSSDCENEIKLLVSRDVDEMRWPRIAQVKEKLGGLRFYVRGQISDQLRLQILQAESDEGESFRICELCGAEGRLRVSSWMRTSCDNCYTKDEIWRRS